MYNAGCNAGKLTIEVVQHLGAASAKGVDIDPSLIDDAKAIAAAAGGIEACEFVSTPVRWEGVGLMR
jgi:ribosomal protein L11 methylase PrmA